MKVLITTVPFGKENRMPLDLLEMHNIEYVINPLNKKLTEDDLVGLISDYDVIIAGTEKITDKVMTKGDNVKFISRVGIGLDSVDLLAAERHGIIVSYTPDAPAPAVAPAPADAPARRQRPRAGCPSGWTGRAVSSLRGRDRQDALRT